MRSGFLPAALRTPECAEIEQLQQTSKISEGEVMQTLAYMESRVEVWVKTSVIKGADCNQHTTMVFALKDWEAR